MADFLRRKTIDGKTEFFLSYSIILCVFFYLNIYLCNMILPGTLEGQSMVLDLKSEEVTVESHNMCSEYGT